MKPKTTAFPRRNPQPKALAKPVTRSAQPKPSPGKSASGLRRLLVAVDFSNPSLAALDAAAALARPSGSSLILLHVAPTQPYPSDMGYIPPDLLVLEKRALQRIQQKLAAVAKQRLSSSQKCETLARQGAVGREIVSTARKVKADLVVVGTRGRTGLKRVFLGSTAEYVLRHSPCPVLTVRHLRPKKKGQLGAGALRFRNILAPVDLLTPALPALRCAVNLAGHLPARLTLLHVVSPVTTPARRPLEVSQRNLELQQAAQAGLEKLARKEAGALLPVPVLVSCGVAEHEILQAAKYSAADLIVLGTTGRRGLKRLLLGSTAEAVVRQASCPVLVVRQPPRPRLRRRKRPTVPLSP